MRFRIALMTALAAVIGIGLLFTFQRPSDAVVQRGFRGTGMEQVLNNDTQAALAFANQLPPPEPPADLTDTKASEVYQNVKVLGDIDAAELTRLMTAMTTWVAPKQGCAYCHNLNNLASDELYTKVVARRMIQMVRHINVDWKNHVGGTGVTCYTCHRGNPVPSYVWFDNPGPAQSLGSLGNRAEQNAPTLSPGMASLPYDPFSPFLDKTNEIRVISTEALPDGNRKSIKQTEWTYALMMHFSQSLGVNCTYCHNTRSFAVWDQSTPQRATAWYGIRMTRDLNTNVLDALHDTLPPSRWGALGDSPKVNCQTCHQGVFKPFYGASALKDYMELAAPNNAVADAAPLPVFPGEGAPMVAAIPPTPADVPADTKLPDAPAAKAPDAPKP